MIELGTVQRGGAFFLHQRGGQLAEVEFASQRKVPAPHDMEESP